jgi:hypothetical protein
MKAPAVTGGARLLLRLDGRRLAAALRYPAPGPLLALLIPLALLLGVLWAAGRAATPAVADAEAAVLLGLLVSGPIAFQAYGTLFRARDEAFLRRLGLPARAVYRERAARYLVLSLAVAGLALVPFTAAGGGKGGGGGAPVAATAAALGAWGGGLVSATLSARAMARNRGRGWGVLAVGIWDAEVTRIVPLLYAPLLPFLAGTVAAGFTGAASGVPALRLAVIGVLALGTARVAQRWHAQALPRFAPQALEMTFEPPPAAGGEMRVGRGLGRLLPAGAASVWVRDAVVAGRRLGWASRLVWPVVLVGFVALARWGGDPAARAWVAAAALLVLLAQAAAALQLGRLERAGPRWVDRSLGLRWQHRLLGRWSWGFGASLWLTGPLALAWSWWSGVPGAWLWPAAGAATAAVGGIASLTAAGWR